MLGLEMIHLLASHSVPRKELQEFTGVSGYLVKDSCLVWPPDVATLPFEKITSLLSLQAAVLW